MTNPNCEVIGFDSAISEFDMSRVFKLEQKETSSILVSGKDFLAVLPTGF